jgi:hypothetical protein
MFCKRGWSAEFMADNFPLSFRGTTLRKHRRKVLVEREKALLPSMQAFVEYKKESTKYEALTIKLREQFGIRYNTTGEGRAAYEKTVSGRYSVAHTRRNLAHSKFFGLNIKIRNLRGELTKYEDESEKFKEILLEIRTTKIARHKAKVEFDSSVAALETMLVEYREARNTLNEATLSWLRYKNLYDGVESEAGRQKREFIMKCADEDCRGFLSTSYKCGTCEKWTCPDCLVVIGTDKDSTHICDPNTVESAKAIKSETRGCPKCATRIFKIDGCDQMWCVMDGCGTAFSWNTGQIITGKVHNPHYYEWLRRTGGGTAPREVGDIPCGGLPDVHRLLNALNDTHHTEHTQLHEILLETHRNVNELISYRLASYPARPEQLANKDLDVDYLMNKITSEEWQRQLELTEAKFIRKREIGQILQTLATAGSDIFREIVNRADVLPYELYIPWLETSGILDDLKNLRQFGNESLLNLSKRDHMAVPQFGENWKWMPIRALYKKPA